MSNGRTISTPYRIGCCHDVTLIRISLRSLKSALSIRTMITTFTGLFLAFQFTGENFLHNIDLLVYALGRIRIDHCRLCGT